MQLCTSPHQSVINYLSLKLNSIIQHGLQGPSIVISKMLRYRQDCGGQRHNFRSKARVQFLVSQDQGLTGRVFQLRVGSGSGIGKNYRVGSGLGSGSGIGIIY